MTVFLVIGSAVGIAALLALTSIWSGYVLSVMWGWFIVPVFHAPALSIPVAIGFSLVVSYLTHQMTPNSERKPGWDEFGSSMAYAFIKPAIALLFGWIVTHWLPA